MKDGLNVAVAIHEHTGQSDYVFIAMDQQTIPDLGFNVTGKSHKMPSLEFFDSRFAPLWFLSVYHWNFVFHKSCYLFLMTFC